MPRITGKESEKISLRHNGFQGKKVKSNTTPEALFHVLLRGSMTVETALALPIFLLAMAMILFLFVVMQIQYIVGSSLDKAVSQTALIREISGAEAENLTKAAFYKELTAQKCPLSQIELGIAGFSWKSTKADDSYIDALVTYRVKFPFGFFGKMTVKLSDGCRMHRWTGYQGNGEKNKDQEWVYITPNGSVYHESPDCTHLKLSVKSISSAKLEKELKNYVPCGHCTKGGKAGAVVYITSEGDCYHVKIDCSGLKRTIYRIPRNQVGNKNPCSRCGGK